MNKRELLNILDEWNFWKNDIPSGIPRENYLNILKRFLKTPQVVLLTGVRRSGKSYLMRQCAQHLIQSGVEKKNILMVNFEDPRFTELHADTLQEIYETYVSFLKPSVTPYIFLDEVQEVEKWEKWVRMAHELKKAKIIVSGSNARLLSRELGTLLTGRHLNVTVFPLSFSECLSFYNIQSETALDVAHERLRIVEQFRQYMEFGAFPEVTLQEEKKEILLHYFDDILYRDLIQRFHIRKADKIKSLARFYLGNISNPVTFNAVKKFLGISVDTIEKFSGYFESAYLFFFLKRFSHRVKEQEKSPRKLYAIDAGLANHIGYRSSQNLGRTAENIVFLELKRRQLEAPGMECYYWKDHLHREVDFVIKRETKVEKLIQVCWNIQSFESRNREVKALLKAMDEFKLKEGWILNEDFEGEEKTNRKIIKFYPLWRWLLEHP